MRLLRHAAFLVLALVSFSLPGVAQAQSPIISYNSQFHPTLAQHGLVVSREYYASEAGLEILKAGGNAVDAAVATGFALAVTLPQAGNIGGGGFMMVYLAKEDRVIAIDYREMAPLAAYRDMYLDANGNVDRNAVWNSLKASGVPGTVMGMTEALANYGTMPLADVMAPAIRLAEEGFPMTWNLYGSLVDVKDRLQSDPASKAFFYKEDGSVYGPGELFRQPVLARTLREIAAKGAAGFYEGWVADALVDTMEAGGGVMTREDLKGYEVKYREPVVGTYRGYKVVTMPPPSSGGVHLVQMLNVLENFDLRSLGHNSAAYLHLLTETMKYAYADRSKYLGDPDFFDVPVAALTDKAYARAIAARIDPAHATPSSQIAPAPKLPYESDQTTHYSVLDRWGNMVANTYTLNFSYGSGISVPGAGFVLNNEMDDFSSKPGVPNAFGLLGGEANAVEARKRPLSSMTPTLVFKDGRPYVAAGSPGGSTIITVVLQTLLNVMDFDMNIQAATSVPRIHHQWYPDRLIVEPGISADTRRLLIGMGHTIKGDAFGDGDRVLGSSQSLMLGPNGLMMGGADPRRPGARAAAF